MASTGKRKIDQKQRVTTAKDAVTKKNKDDKANEADSKVHSEELQALATIQGEVEKLNTEMNEELVEIERKYNKKKAPIYKRRNEVIKKIPEFWLQCFSRHLVEYLSEVDISILKNMRELDVDDKDKHGFIITFTFDENDFFPNKVLSKEFKYDENSDVPTISSSTVDWKDPKFVDEHSDSFFVRWFTQTEEQTDLVLLGEEIREKLFKNPLEAYTNQGDDDDYQGEDDDGDAGEVPDAGEEEPSETEDQ